MTYNSNLNYSNGIIPFRKVTKKQNNNKYNNVKKDEDSFSLSNLFNTLFNKYRFKNNDLRFKEINTNDINTYLNEIKNNSK